MRQYFNFNISDLSKNLKVNNLVKSLNPQDLLKEITNTFYKPFSKERSNLIALDIGPSSIKLIELGKRQNKIVLENFATISLPEGCINSHHIESYSILTERLKELVFSQDYAERDASVVLAGPQIVTQLLKIPVGLEDHQLATHVELEAEKFLPFSTEEVAMDFDVLDTRKKPKDQTEVLLVATKKAFVDEYISIIKASDLHVKVMDVYSCVIGRLIAHVVPKQLQEDVSDKTIAMVDIGHDILTVSIYKNDRQLYLKEQNFGGKVLNELIQKEHIVDYQLAEDLKLKHNDPAILKLITNFVNQLSMQIYHMLQFFYASTNTDQLDHIMLFGGSATLPGIIEAIFAKTNIQAKILDPFIDIDTQAFASNKEFNQTKSRLAIACGLALRSHVG